MTRAATAYQSATTGPPMFARIAPRRLIAASARPVLWQKIPRHHES